MSTFIYVNKQYSVISKEQVTNVSRYVAFDLMFRLNILSSVWYWMWIPFLLTQQILIRSGEGRNLFCDFDSEGLWKSTVIKNPFITTSLWNTKNIQSPSQTAEFAQKPLGASKPLTLCIYLATKNHNTCSCSLLWWAETKLFLQRFSLLQSPSAYPSGQDFSRNSLVIMQLPIRVESSSCSWTQEQSSSYTADKADLISVFE